VKAGEPIFGGRPAGAGLRIVNITLLFLFGNLNADFIIKITLMGVYKIMCLSESCKIKGSWQAAPQAVSADCGCPACYHRPVTGARGARGQGSWRDDDHPRGKTAQ
jgi:hypothetical protein